MAFNLFSTVERAMQTGIGNAVASMSGSWAGTMTNLIGASLALFITCTAFAVIAGKIQEPLNELLWKLGAILMVLAFLDNANGWIGMVQGAVTGLKDTLTQGGSAMATLDRFVTDMVQVSELLRAQADWDQLIYLLPAFWFGVILVVIASFYVMLLNTISLTLVLAFTPCAIGCLAYPQTKGIFSAWLNLCLSNIFTIMFMAIIFKGIQGIAMLMVNADITNSILLAVTMILLGLTAAKFAALAVSLGEKLAAVSVDSAKAATSAQKAINETKLTRPTAPSPAPAPTPPTPTPKG